jgi:hypothetical protein
VRGFPAACATALAAQSIRRGASALSATTGAGSAEVRPRRSPRPRPGLGWGRSRAAGQGGVISPIVAARSGIRRLRSRRTVNFSSTGVPSAVSCGCTATATRSGAVRTSSRYGLGGMCANANAPVAHGTPRARLKQDDRPNRAVAAEDLAGDLRRLDADRPHPAAKRRRTQRVPADRLQVRNRHVRQTRPEHAPVRATVRRPVDAARRAEIADSELGTTASAWIRSGWDPDRLTPGKRG